MPDGRQLPKRGSSFTMKNEELKAVDRTVKLYQ